MAKADEVKNDKDLNGTIPQGDSKEAAGAPPADNNVTPPEGDTSPSSKEQKPKGLKIKNSVKAGHTVFGVSGKPVKFDDSGVAEVGDADFEHFCQIPGYEKA